jgi:hypothetical protein
MSTLFRIGSLRFFYLSFDLLMEPCHVHVGDGAGKLCKFWIRVTGDIVFEESAGFNQRELKQIEKTLLNRINEIKQAYEDECQRNNITIDYYQKEG